MEKLGVNIHLEKATTEVLGDDCVTGLAFKDGSTLDCDMLVIAAGIRPNAEIGFRAELLPSDARLSSTTICAPWMMRMSMPRANAPSTSRPGLRPRRAPVGARKSLRRPYHAAQSRCRLSWLQARDQAEGHGRGNADCTRLDLADGKKMLIDYADMRNRLSEARYAFETKLRALEHQFEVKASDLREEYLTEVLKIHTAEAAE